MYNFFILFLPSILGIKTMDILDKNIKKKDYFIYYLIFVLLSNIICFAIIIILNKFDGNIVLYMSEHLQFSLKYLILSSIVNIIISNILTILKKYFSISLEVKNEKNTKNN